MEKIISYTDLPISRGQSIYIRNETDPKLYISLLAKGYRVVSQFSETEESTIFLTGNRQIYGYSSKEKYITSLDKGIQNTLLENGISKPKTVVFSYNDLIEHKYKLPFVLKNENINGGREKFLINTEEDYENLISACSALLNKNLLFLLQASTHSGISISDYDKYLNLNFSVQEYIKTPSEFNTTVRLLTSSSNDLLYAALKYREPVKMVDNTTLLGYLLSEIYPISTPSIVSNTLRGGHNILIGNGSYSNIERILLNKHNINSNEFEKLVQATRDVHEKYKRELGIIGGFDYIYDEERQQWFLLEYHDKPMVGDYSIHNGLAYETKEDRLVADGRVRATALSLTLKKTK